LASKLNGSSLTDEVEFGLLESDPWKPVLILRSADKLGKHVKVRLLIVPEADSFKLSQLGPDKANIKSKWATGIEDEEGQCF